MIDLVTDPAILDAYLRDASGVVGHAEGLVRPRTAEEVAETLAHCQARAIPVTVSARRTSVTAASVPVGGWVLSTEHLCAVHAPDDADGGVLLGDYQAGVEATGQLFPPDPTSRRECSLGAAVACNASGARAFRYGPTRPWVEAVQVVLATGEILWADRGTPVPEGWPNPAWTPPGVKTAAGYGPADNLLDLLIGSEGTLGVITRVRTRLVPLPADVLGLVAFFPSTGHLLAMLEAARVHATRPGRAIDGPLNPRAIEYFDRNALDLVAARVPGIPEEATGALFMEVEHAGEPPLDAWWDALAAHGALVDATVVADDDKGRRRLHDVRHAVPAGVNERVNLNGMPKLSTDFAVPDDALPAMMAAYEATGLPHVLFGHIGDSHLHLNLLPRDASELAAAKARYVDLAHRAVQLGGTVSAEHGIGKIKRELLAHMAGQRAIDAFRALKAAADPAWILGRGNLLEPPA